MQDSIHFAAYIDVIGNIMLVEGKFFIPHQVCDVFATASDKIIQSDHLMSVGKEAVAKMRAEKSGRLSDQYSHVLFSSRNRLRSIYGSRRSAKVVISSQSL